MAAPDNFKIERRVDMRPRPIILDCKFRESSGDVEARKGLRETLESSGLRENRVESSSNKASSRMSARSAAEAIFASNSTSSRVENRMASAMVWRC